MSFPFSLDAFSTKVDGVNREVAADMNAVQSAVVAIEQYIRPTINLATYAGCVPQANASDASFDNTDRIQGALQDASTNGFGTRVYLPGSQYGWNVSGILDVPTGVAWVSDGAGRPGLGTYERTSTLPAAYKYRGAQLNTTANAGVSTSSLSFITVNRNAMVQGLSVFYPNQTATNPPILYPPAMRFSEDSSGKYGGGAILDCCLINPYIGIRAVQHDAFHIKGITGQPLNKGITVDDVHNTPLIEDVLWWQVWKELNASPNLDAYIAANAVAFEFLDVDMLQFDKLFSYGYKDGLVLGKAGSGGYGQGGSFGAENCSRGIVYQEGSASGWQIDKVDIIASSRGILVTGGTAGTSAELQIGKAVLEVGGGIGLDVLSTAHQPVKISQVRFHDWTTAAIRTASIDADIMITDVNFWHSTGPHLDVSALSNTATAYIALNHAKYRGQARNIVFGATAPSIRGVQSGGVAQVPITDNKIVVNHTLGAQPVNYTLSPVGDTQGLSWWADTFTTTQFTIRMSAIPAPAVSFAWTAQLSND